jgi:hypothetical protein
MLRPDARALMRLRAGRPGFMSVTALAAVVTTALVGWLGERLYDPREAHAAVAREVDESLRDELLRSGFAPLPPEAARGTRRLGRHGVEVMVPSAHFSLPLGNGPVSGEPPSDTSAAVAILTEELSRYPSGFLGQSGISRMILCSKLRENERAIPSLPNYQHSLILDVEAPADFLRRVLHHEVFHFADYADDEQVQRDPAWESINAHFFTYGPGGRFVRDPATSDANSAPVGFVTPYAASALEEDKAETFAFMMVAPGLVRERCQSDRVLAEKVRAIRRQLSAFSPDIDGAFWARTGAGP